MIDSALAPVVLDKCDPTTSPPRGSLTRRAKRGADEKLVAAVEAALRSAGHVPLRNVRVAVYRGLVILRGPVPSFYLKQLSQAIVQRVARVRRLQNDLDVVSGE